MAFLDNEGSITLDAVLTTAGRKRLAKGDGSFNIAGFSLGDDEINYGLYNPDHSQGTAYYDLDIMQTPVLEAITGGGGLKHKLMTLPQDDHLYLPVVKINTNSADAGADFGKPLAVDTGANANKYVIVCTKNVFDAYSSLIQGFIDVRSAALASQHTQLIPLDQGLDRLANETGWDKPISEDLNETQFIVQIDSRLATIVTPASTVGGETVAGGDAVPAFVDDDHIATYYLTDSPFYFGYPSNQENASVVAGSRGLRFKFGIRCSDNLNNNNSLFKQLGSTLASFYAGTNITTAPLGDETARYIDSTIRVVGNKTGISIDIPIRFVRENDT